MELKTAEVRLLSVCARAVTQEDEAAIRQILNEGIDWTVFAQGAIDRGVTSLVGYALLRVAPDILPDDILAAFHVIVNETRTKNRALLDELARKIAEVPSVGPAALAIQKACVTLDQALTENPSDAGAWHRVGQALSGFSRHSEAILCFKRAIALAPDNAASWRDCAIAMIAISQVAGAVTYFQRALAVDSQDARAWALLSQALCMMKRYAEASEASDRALLLDSDYTFAEREGINSRLFACDWRRRIDDKRRITEGVDAGRYSIPATSHRAISDSEAEHLALARRRAREYSRDVARLWCGERYRHDKIRIAYISTDFRDTLSVNAIASCFEGHDKTRFETTAISLNSGDGSETRRRIEAAFNRFIDVEALSDAEIATILRDIEVDIAIDLNGYSGDNRRTGILVPRPSPVQVNYLGYPGTMGAPFIDYIIADRILIPEQNRIHYSEQVVYLPHTYFPTDRNRRIAEHTPNRAEEGLPEAGFVFACHNTAYKISPEIFDIWMRLLGAVEGSVLWLSSTISSAIVNLQREARARGIAPNRLIFASRAPQREDHLARLRLADLFLDTLPYNAHTTASDALWAGLPVLTCLGNSFPARVAASLLNAIGLRELVTSSLAEYEALALGLARDPERLAAIKAKLMRNRDTEPLFDTPRFTRNLETAYTMMWERAQRGEPPMSFAVPDAL